MYIYLYSQYIYIYYLPFMYRICINKISCIGEVTSSGGELRDLHRRKCPQNAQTMQV